MKRQAILFLKSILFFLIVGLIFVSPGLAQPVLQPHAAAVEKWSVFELTFKDPSNYQNPFWDAEISAQFTSSSGKSFTVHGFYFQDDLWKVRFAPTKIGNWIFSAVYKGKAGEKTFQGSFTCTNASAQNHGFIMVNPQYKHSFIQSDGSPFIPIGLNGHTPAICGALLGINPGPQQVPLMWTKLAANSVNTFRLMMFHNSAFSPTLDWNKDEGHANLLYQTPSLDQYNLRSCQLLDRWFSQAQSHNIAIYLCMFAIIGNSEFPFVNCPWSTAQGGPFSSLDEMYQSATGLGADLQKKYVAYVVRRWGAFRNLVLWEYNNEYGARCKDDWLSMMEQVIGENDPYGRPRTVSFWDSRWSRDSSVNDHAGVTVTDDHFYKFVMNYSEFEGADAANTQANYRFKKYKKPVMFGEFGSGEGFASNSDFKFQTTAYWGALTGGGFPLFWLSGANDTQGIFYNMDTLKFLKAAGRVVTRIAHFPSLVPHPDIAEPASSEKIKTDSLWNGSECLTYIHNFKNHVSVTSGESIEFNLPGIIACSYSAVWIDAIGGQTLAAKNGISETGTFALTVPNFVADILILLKLNNIMRLYSPLEFSVRQVLNRSLSQKEYINVLSWKNDPRNGAIAKFRIYTLEAGELKLLDEVDSAKLEYLHRHVDKDARITYAITALDANAKESPPAYFEFVPFT